MRRKILWRTARNYNPDYEFAPEFIRKKPGLNHPKNDTLISGMDVPTMVTRPPEAPFNDFKIVD